MTEFVKSIKGTDTDIKCRGYQFEIGKAHTHEGAVSVCDGGFHACPVDQHPLSVFEFYAPETSRYWEVTQSGAMSKKGTKLASATITIDFELSIGDLVKRAWDYVWNAADKSDVKSHATGTRGAASSTGYQGAASSTGTRGAASSTGTRGAASSTGNQGAASSTGDYGAASSTGYQGAASSTGDYGAAMASGYESRVMGAKGNAIFAVERNSNYEIISVASAIVGQNGIDAGTWYVCRNGQFVAS